MTDILIKRRILDTDLPTPGECHEKMKAETGVINVQAKKCHKLPSNQQKLGERHGTNSLSQASEGMNCADALISRCTASRIVGQSISVV